MMNITLFHLTIEFEIYHFYLSPNPWNISTLYNTVIKTNWKVGYLDGVAKELNLGLPRTDPSCGRMEDLNSGPPDYETGVLTTQPPRLPLLLEDFLQGSIPPQLWRGGTKGTLDAWELVWIVHGSRNISSIRGILQTNVRSPPYLVVRCCGSGAPCTNGHGSAPVERGIILEKADQ